MDHFDMMTIILRLKAAYGSAFEPMTVVSGSALAEIAAGIAARAAPEPSAAPVLDKAAWRVRAAAARVLKVEESQIDMHADLSEYGLDSINIMFMLAGLKEHFGIEFEPKEVIEHRTWSDLAAHLARLQNGVQMAPQAQQHSTPTSTGSKP